MKNTALLLVAVLALGATPARAEVAPGKPRGFLSGLGLGLLIGGLTGGGVGVAGVVAASDANLKMAAFPMPIPAAEVAAFDAMRSRASSGNTQAIVGFLLGGLALAGGITCLVIDGLGPSTTVTFAPTVGGGTFVFSARF